VGVVRFIMFKIESLVIVLENLPLLLNTREALHGQIDIK
jgi:hypothetical protein